ncbi:MAG: hypothetical protein V1773_09940 [bacterium]
MQNNDAIKFEQDFVKSNILFGKYLSDKLEELRDRTKRAIEEVFNIEINYTEPKSITNIKSENQK